MSRPGLLFLYAGLGVRTQILTISVTSIPTPITVSEMRCPGSLEPVTRGRIAVDSVNHDLMLPRVFSWDAISSPTILHLPSLTSWPSCSSSPPVGC